MLAIIICLIVLAADQASKFWAVNNLQSTKGIKIIGDVLEFQYVENRGAAFGILQGQMWLFYVLTVVVIAILIYYLFHYVKDSLFMNITIGLILGGALGNFVDRLFRSFVVDFIKIDLIDSYRFPVFNIADIAITVGAVLFFIYVLFIDDRLLKE